MWRPLGITALALALGCGPIVVVEDDASSQASGGAATTGAGGDTSGTTAPQTTTSETTTSDTTTFETTTSDTTASQPDGPETLATGVTGTGLAIDADHLYFSSEYRLWKMPKAGGAPQPITGEIWDTPQGLAVDETHIYWQSYSAESVHRASLTSGIPEVVASDLGTSPQWLVLDAARVYFPTDGTPTSVLSVPKTGGPALTHATGGDPNHVALDATHVYWAAQTGVHRADKLGGDIETLSSVAGYLRGIAVDATDVYFADPSTGSILKVSKLGGPEVKLVTGEANPSLDAADGTHVYWTNYVAAGKVARAPKSGGPPEVLAAAQNKPAALVVDDSHAYWINSGDDTLVRVALP